MRQFLRALRVGRHARQFLGVRLGRLLQYPPRPLSIAALAHKGSDENLPLISLVTPSLNHGRFIGQTLTSVLAQQYPRLEYVVQDARSSDGTSCVLEAFADKPITIRVEVDDGQADALNRGFNGTLGEIMGYLNSDDLLLPGALHLVGRFFRDHPQVDVIYGNRLIIDETGQEIGRWVLPGHDAAILRQFDYVPQETLFWRRRVWNRTGGRFDASLHFAMDWELLLRLLEAGAVFRHLPDLFGVFRVHGEQKSQAKYHARGRQEMAILRARHRGTSLRSLRGVVLHGKYLLRHRRADAAFARSR